MALARKLRSAVGEIAGYGVKGLPPDHDVPLLGTLAQDPKLAVAVGYVIGVKADDLTDSEAGSVDQLQKGAVPQSEGGGAEGGFYKRGGFLGREELGELLVQLREAEPGHGIGLEPALANEEPVEGAQHADLAGYAPHVVAVFDQAVGDADAALGGQPCDVLPEQVSVDGVEIVYAVILKEVEIGYQVRPVVADGVRREVALSFQIQDEFVEVVFHGDRARG